MRIVRKVATCSTCTDTAGLDGAISESKKVTPAGGTLDDSAFSQQQSAPQQDKNVKVEDSDYSVTNDTGTRVVMEKSTEPCSAQDASFETNMLGKPPSTQQDAYN